MKLILGRPRRRRRRTPVFFTIGVFDGVHRGHRYIIDSVVKEAKRNHSRSLLITFFPYPQDFLQKRFWGYLTTLEEKVRILRRLELDYVWIMKFDYSLYLKKGEEFIQYIKRYFNIKKLFVGEDFRFGYRQEADIRKIENIGKEKGFSLRIVKSLKVGKRKISSSFIRELIKRGQLELAESFLGYPYYLGGVVRRFSKLAGSVLGFPTANLETKGKLLPPEGVYIVKVDYQKRCYQGIANLGVGETLKRGERVLEVHLFNFRKNIYGKYIEVIFLKKIRGEKKFSTPLALKKQIEADIATAKKYFSRHKILYSQAFVTTTC